MVQRKTWLYYRKGADRNEYQKRHVSRPCHRLEHKQFPLSKRDYDLTGTDSSDNGVKKATKISANNNINLMVDNILNSKLKKMDLIIF